MVNMVAYFLVDAEIILSTFVVVGISGIFLSHVYFGFVHWILFVLQNQSYAKQSLVLVALLTLWFAMYSLIECGLLRSAFWSSCLRLKPIDFIVFSCFPRCLAFIRVFIIWVLVEVWGRRLVGLAPC